jgi:hypothetical protein
MTTSFQNFLQNDRWLRQGQEVGRGGRPRQEDDQRERGRHPG